MIPDKILKFKIRYVKENTKKMTAMGYLSPFSYVVFLKQSGEGLIVKRADEVVKNESRIEFKDFYEFLDTFDMCCLISVV